MWGPRIRLSAPPHPCSHAHAGFCISAQRQSEQHSRFSSLNRSIQPIQSSFPTNVGVADSPVCTSARLLARTCTFSRFCTASATAVLPFSSLNRSIQPIQSLCPTNVGVADSPVRTSARLLARTRTFSRCCTMSVLGVESYHTEDEGVEPSTQQRWSRWGTHLGAPQAPLASPQPPLTTQGRR